MFQTFGVGAGVLQRGVRAKSESEKGDSAHLCGRGEHGQDQDWISCRILANFGSELHSDIYFCKKLDQDICLISITKFSRE